MKTLYFNGIIFTGTDLVNHFVVEDGVFVCEKQDATIAYDACVDLEGQFVCAGFNDSHLHLLNYGKALLMAQLHKHTTSLEDLLHYGKAFLEAHPLREGQWLQGRGFNQDYFQDVKRMPTRWDLDQISTTIPIVFTRACGHCCVVNSKALEVAGINSDTKEVLGGTIGKNEDGELNGLFFDNAMNYIQEALPLPEKEDIKKMLLVGAKALNSYGITSCQSDDYCVYREIPVEVINEAYQELIEEKQLSVRVYEQCNFTQLEELKKFIDTGTVTGVGNDYFKIGPLKMLGDGSLGSRTAYLSQPYADDPSTRGFTLFTDEVMDAMVGYASEKGMQVAVHAIGDACLEQVLNAIEKALLKYPRKNHRHGIVHCQISRREQLERMARLGLHIYAQTIFLDYDNHIVEARVGKDLASSSYSWETLMDKGLHVSNGSDAPVEIPDVMKGMECAITRTSIDGCGPYLEEEAFTVEEAIRSFTMESAYASFEETKKGQIKEGYVADFVILSANPFTTEARKIHTIQVLKTYLNGVCVYEKGGV